MKFRFFIKLFALLFGAFSASSAMAADSHSCQNYFRQWMAPVDHQGLTNSAFGLDYTKFGSVFIVQKDGLPYYPPHWKLGIFTHSYLPVELSSGSISPTLGSVGNFQKGEMLILKEAKVSENEARLKLLSYKKFSIKPDDSKLTDRVSLELIVPKGGDWCRAKRSLEAWVRGFGGMLEAERYQKGGDAPPPEPVATETPSKKPKKQKEPVEKKTEPKEEAATSAPEPIREPAPPPSVKSKPANPTSVEALYPPRETNLKTGMTRSEVDAKLGKPINVISAGDKSVVYYEDVIVEFQKNKLTDIRLSDKPAPSVLKRYH